MLIVNEQKITAETQDFVFDELHITGGEQGKLEAIISFVVNNEKGERIDTRVCKYSGEDFNGFWENFNSGKFLYEELVKKEDLDVKVPKDIEESFVNVEPVAEEAPVEVVEEAEESNADLSTSIPQ